MIQSLMKISSKLKNNKSFIDGINDQLKPTISQIKHF